MNRSVLLVHDMSVCQKVFIRVFGSGDISRSTVLGTVGYMSSCLTLYDPDHLTGPALSLKYRVRCVISYLSIYDNDRMRYDA